METSGKELREYTIDLVHIAKVLFRKLWVIILGGVLAAAAAFYVAAFIITPQYSSSVRIYVNNSAISLGNTSLSISSSEISAAQSLVRTYIVILKDTTTLEKIIEKANLPYSPGQLGGMINAYSVNDTEIMRINLLKTWRSAVILWRARGKKSTGLPITPMTDKIQKELSILS